jgi:ribonuclease HII
MTTILQGIERPTRGMRTPNLRYEKILRRQGGKFLAGVDEVGRGCFAGPVVAGCVVFPTQLKVPKEITINDSKKLSAEKREKASVWIKDNALSWGIGEASATLINRIGMAKATKRAFRKAVSECRRRLGKPIDYLLVDAFFIPFVPGLPTRRRKDRKGRYLKNPKGRQMAIVDGDEKSLTIAAASIIAKTYRDRLMKQYSKDHPRYQWANNKGYGTRAHQNAIIKYGLTRYHRKEFVNTFLTNRGKA